MKLQLNIETLAGDSIVFDLLVAPTDSVKEVKDRIVAIEPNPFSDQSLLFKGKTLADEMCMAECNIEDGASLSFKAKATDAAFAKQLEDIISESKPKEASLEELTLLYALRHGVTVGQALQALGKNELLKTFLERAGKRFKVDGEMVGLLSGSAKEEARRTQVDTVATQLLTLTVLVTLHSPAAIRRAADVQLSVRGDATVQTLKERIAALAQVPFMDLYLCLAGKTLKNEATVCECGITNLASVEFVAVASEKCLVEQLVSLVKEQGPISRLELDDAYSLRHGVSATQAVQMLGWNEKFQHFIDRQPTLTVQHGAVGLGAAAAYPCAPPGLRSAESDNRPYLDLHAKLHSAAFEEKVDTALDALASRLASETFLNISRIVKGGAAANGTALPGAVGAELALFVEGLPPTGQDAWLPGLALSVAGTLNERLSGEAGILSVRADGAVVRMQTDGVLGEVTLLLSPAYASYGAALAAFKRQVPRTSKAGAAAFSAQKARFVERQSWGTKATLRLVKWWREQRQWSSPATRPSDALLELVVAHATAQSVPRDLHEAVSAVLKQLAHFDALTVTWPLASRSYKESDVAKELLQQRPLVLDPVNPLVNVADPRSFQADELMKYARSGRFF